MEATRHVAGEHNSEAIHIRASIESHTYIHIKASITGRVYRMSSIIEYGFCPADFQQIYKKVVKGITVNHSAF